MDKANFEIEKKELTVYFELIDGPEAPCYYCRKIGPQQLVHVNEIKQGQIDVGLKSRLGKLAVRELQQKLFHGRAICKLGSSCEERLNEERADCDKIILTIS